MFYIVFAILAGLVIAAAVLVAVLSPASRFGASIVAAVVFIALLIVTVVTSATIVEARSIAIQTSFGRYAGTLEPGLNWTAPWSSAESFSTTLQALDLNSQTNDEVNGKQNVAINYLGGGRGWVDITVRWQISSDRVQQEIANDRDGAKKLWEKYRTFDSVRDNLIQSSVKDVTLNVFNDYQPNEARTSQDVISGKIKEGLGNRFKEYGVTIDSVSVTGTPLDEPTQASLDRILASAANVTNAENERQRALKDAETAKIRQGSGAFNQVGNQRFCLDLVNNWNAAKNGPLPATFNCDFSGGDKASVGVLVPASK